MGVFTAAAVYFGGKAVRDMVREPAEKAKEARKIAAFQASDAQRRAREEAAAIDERATVARRDRRAAVARNETVVADPLGLGGKAETVRKVLTGL